MAVGDVGCGKTSLLLVFSTDKALDGNTPQKPQNEVIDVEIDGVNVALSICSTAGEKLYA